MTYTDRQKREAFYKAAEVIETRPDLYRFSEVHVGEGGCPACMWGHVGRVLGINSGVLISKVAEDCGFGRYNTEKLYDLNDSDLDVWKPEAAAQLLRRAADHHWPDHQINYPDWNAMATRAVTKEEE